MSKAIVNINFNICDNKIRGRHNQIRAVLQVEHSEARAMQQAVLTSVLFEDLQELKQNLLIFIDTYEKGVSEVQEWISGPFLMRVANTENVRVAIAGQEVPNPNTIEWGHCCELHELHGVREAKHWLPVVEALKREVPGRDDLTYLMALCDVFKGRPLKIMSWIEGFPDTSKII